MTGIACTESTLSVPTGRGVRKETVAGSVQALAVTPQLQCSRYWYSSFHLKAGQISLTKLAVPMHLRVF